MNIHTVEISYLLGPRLIRQFCQSQQWFHFNRGNRRNVGWQNIIDFVNASAQNVIHCSDCLESEMYIADGIQKVTLVRNPSRRGYFYFVAIVNLESLYRRDVTVESFQCTEERLQRCSEEFSTIMRDFSNVPFRSLLEWSTRRVDYTVDARHPGLAPLYITLAQRGRIPRGMVQRQRYTGSYYLESPNDDVTINFYDKEAQLRNDRYLHNDDRLLREAHGLLRFEVQCQGRKLDHIRNMVRRRGLPHYGMQLRTFLNAEIANAVVQHYYYNTIGYLDYYDFPSVERHLQEQPGRRDMKERILLFLQQVEQAGSVASAIQSYYQAILPNGAPALISGPESSLQNLLNTYLPRFEINPVTIPTDCGRGRLANPMPLCMRSNR